MSFDGMMVQAVTLLTPGTVVDRYGDTLPDWNTASGVAYRAWISQTGSQEDQAAGRDAHIGEWVAYLPADATPTAGDRIVWTEVTPAVTFEVDGPPLPAYVPRGGSPILHHWEMKLRVVAG